MVLILLLLLCNPDNLILKLNSYLHEGWLFIDSFKVGSVPGMINKEMLVQLYIILLNHLKNCSSSKIWKNYYSMYIEERGRVNAQIFLLTY